MQGINACAPLGLLTLLVAACASSGSSGWVELKPESSAGPTLKLAGTVHRLDVEGGVWVIRDAQGASSQPTNLPEAFRKEGMSVEAEGRRRDNVVSIGMAGSLIDLIRIRQRTDAARAALAGTVAYRERLALPPSAVVTIQLADVSIADAPSSTIAETTIEVHDKQVPIPFELTYDSSAISSDRMYAVRATIRDGDTLMFTTTSSYPVITRGNPSRVDLMLQRVTAASGATPTLRGTSWILEDLAGAGVVDRVQATLVFAEDGTVSGIASCNQFRGPVTVTGATISFGNLAATRKACPEAVMRQEQQYLDALGNANRFEIKGSLLYIHATGRSQPLRFVRDGA